MAIAPSSSHPPLLDTRCALFLDVDGTLIEFADDPACVHLLPQVREDIGRISGRLDGAVALVSGRPLSQLDALFAPLQLPAAGLHGHQMRASQHAEQAAQLAPEWLHELHQKAMVYAHARPGVLVEDKGVSLALHWRGAPELGEEITRLAHEHLPSDAGYRLQPGDHVIEYVPAGADKGRAVEQLMQYATFKGRTPVYVGDDLTDEYGFAAANALGGWSVLVGARESTAAGWRLRDPAAVHAWLRDNAR